MKLNEFTLEVPQGREMQDGYVQLNHNQIYSIKLKNQGSTDCDANVFVDGDSVGTFRINKFSSVILERPCDIGRKFTFYRLDSEEADIAELNAVDLSDLGLISVVFTPAKKTLIRDTNMKSLNYGRLARSSMALNANAGGTGLSERSDQTFVGVRPLDYDYTLQTTINIRLIAAADDDASIIPLKKKKKLVRQSSNNIPPSVA